MTTNTEANDKWFTIYVPASTGGVQSYLRLGSPDTTTESGFLTDLKTAYAAQAAQSAVRAAFDTNATGGLIFYTAGDLVQFVNGTSDTRVLNNRYVVHVLNKETIDGASTKKATDSVKTYRTYLRLGKPYDAIESELQGNAPDDKLKELINNLAPAAPSPQITDADTKRAAAAGGDNDARSYLQTAAQNGDRNAIDAINQLLSDTHPDAVVWARTTLQALHLKFANTRKNEALANTGDGRAKLAANANGSSPVTAQDPVARRKLIEIYEIAVAGLASGGTVAGVSSSLTVAKVTDAQTWAKGVLAGLPKVGSEVLSRWSQGDGVALYSDRAIAMTTPDKLKVTVGSDSRTVFGPTYSEVYDVSDDTIAKIKDGTIATLDQVPDKTLITATLVARDIANIGWRSSKFDQSKALSFACNDSGSFSLSSSYSFGAGLKFSNGITAGFDASVGLAVSLSPNFKVDLSKAGISTSHSFGDIAYKNDAKTSATSIKLAVDQVANVSVKITSETMAKVAQGAVIALNVAALGYTAAAAIIANKKSGSGDSETSAMRAFLQAGEKVYVAATVINAALLAAGLVAGVIQLGFALASNKLQAALPAQVPNVLINSSGIKLQCGTSYIHIDSTGIALYGQQMYIAAPATQVLPVYLTGNLTPAQITDCVQDPEAAFGVLDLFS